VLKAVLMNSADKLIDDGTIVPPGETDPVPQGSLLGMERTIVDQNGLHWLQSEAYDDDAQQTVGYFPLDDQMGAGHLNATRAVQQFRNGEFDSDAAEVPAIGWDYGHTSGVNERNEYVLSDPLTAGSFISITLAWDRVVTFNTDADMDGEYDVGDTFQESTAMSPNPDNDDLINDLGLWLLPKDSFNISQAIAGSTSPEGTLEHIFFQIPTTGEYEIWVLQGDGDIPGGQDYALAWWYGLAPPLVVQGDYTGDGIVDADDYQDWRSRFGNMVSVGSGADGNGDGIVNAADYVIWRKQLSAGSGSLAAVPEPASMALLIVAGIMMGFRGRKGTGGTL
jgi:hypothetical protein